MLPMFKILPSKIEKKTKNLKPKDETLYKLLNYSKALISESVNQKRVLINLN